MKTIFLLPEVARHTAPIVLLLICVLTSSVVFSQAQLLKDINTSEYHHFFNEYSQLINGQGEFYFVSNGKELWKSGGTTSGTKRVRMTGTIHNLTSIGNMLYFGSTTGSAAELWKSDGTYAGTMRVKQIRKGINGGPPKSFTNVNGIVFFVADNGTGYELWKTNGTLSGTVLVKDIWRGAEGSNPSYLTEANGILYFSADDGVYGRELWKSDGTAAGTVMVKDIQTEDAVASEPMELVTLNGFLFFSANHALSGRELWSSDGTASGTILLNDINPGAASAEIGSIRRLGDAIYFNAKTEAIGTALWRSSGTAAGTVMLTDLTSDESEFEVFDMTVLNNRIYWLLNTYYGYEVWVSNGTAADTRLVTTFENRDTPAQFTYMNNKIYYFSAYWSPDPYAPFQQLCSINPDGSEWREIWKMERPFTLNEEEDEDWYGYSMDIVAFNDALFFPAVRNEAEGYKLLKSNGTETPPAILVDTYKPTQSSSPNMWAKNNSAIYFTAYDDFGGNRYLWRTDGTSAGTVRMKSPSGTRNFVTINNTIYFTVTADTTGWQLWRTDGTITGTVMVKEDNSYGQDFVVGMVKAEDRLFFFTGQKNLWMSDGTAAGTVLLKKFSHVEHLEHLGAFGSDVYALVKTLSGGQELWKTNGTSAGTVKVRTIRWVAGPTAFVEMTSATLGNIFYFVGNNGTHGFELWRTDGTATGTFMVKDIRTADNHEWFDVRTDIWIVTTFNNTLYIQARNAEGEILLFKSNGTNAGTTAIHESDGILGPNSSQEKLLFFSTDSSALSLWATDGTTAGTTLVKELPAPVSYEYTISSKTHLNGILYFAYPYSNVIWRSDGTECGTFDIEVGLKDVTGLDAIGSSLLISGGHHYYGYELFTFNVSNVSVPLCPEALSAIQETSTEVTNEDESKHVTFAPNPFDHDFTFVVNSNQSTAEVAVYDMSGHPLMLDLLETNKPHQLGSKWNEGLYIIRITVDGKVTYKRVVKGRQ